MGGWRFPAHRRPRKTSGEAPPASPFVVLYDGARGRGLSLTRPLAAITGWEEGLHLSMGGREERWRGNPLDHLDEAFALAAALAQRLGHSGACFAGAFHFDLRRCIERFGAPAPERRGPPWLRWHLFSGIAPWAPIEPGPSPPPALRPTESSLDRPAFERAVRRILDHEVRGDVYQVNLTRQVRCLRPERPFSAWEKLAVRARAPFSSYADLGEFRILSLSPERFLAREGDLVWTEPIKGTAPRGNTEEEDAASLAGLLSGEKEAAELAMIVDVE